VPLVDPTHPGAGMLASLGAADPAAIIDVLARTPDRGVELSLRLVRAHLDTGRPAAARAELAAVARRAPGDWRTAWYGGLVALHTGDARAARTSFEAVWDALPGEVAPQLALGAAAELDGDATTSARRYERVWRVDRGYPSAAFGLARVRAAAGDLAGAVAVLDEIPDSSSHHVAAQVATVRLRLRGTAGEADLADASLRLGRLRLDAEHRAQLAVELFRAALALLGVSPERPDRAERRSRVPAPRSAGPSAARVLGRRLQERDIRLGLEAAYRQLAAAQTDTLARYALVDRANAVRPRTMV
jgi:serine/threonine-protein kinase PknG